MTVRSPVLGPLDLEYWSWVERGELRLQHCACCAAWQFPPAPVCRACLSRELEWEQVRGTGVVWSWIRMHRGYIPAYADRVPYNVVLVRLDEGPMMISSVIGDALDIHCAAPVRLEFGISPEGWALPMFRVGGATP
jgi:hypothetical protein